jgi:SAM-dependent methyltransferase/3-polyprenyl-4-hydroxybenzoate decarboxylase
VEYPALVHYVRSHRAVVVDVGESVVILGRDVRRIDGDSAEVTRAVVGFLARPHTRDEVIAHVAALAGTTAAQAAKIVGEVLELLVGAGAIGAPRAATPAPRGVNVVVGITGAIAATHAPALITSLHQRGHAVEVAATPTATRFVALDALSAIAQREVHTSLWPRGGHAPPPHVALAHWADVVVVYPASATSIARIAAGDCSELVAAIATTTRAPVVVVPSMNLDMIESPAVVRNLAKLRGDGRAVVHGVPSLEAADVPAVRRNAGSVAPPPSEVVAALDALLAADALPRRVGAVVEVGTPRKWDAAYRAAAAALSPVLDAPADADIIAALAAHAPPPGRLLELGCGVGAIARHAAALGYRAVGADVSEVALALARARDTADAVVWLRDDACATALSGPFDVVVDRGVLHVLARDRAAAWAASIARVAARTVIVKVHRDGLPGESVGWSRADLAALLPDHAIVAELDVSLPHPRGGDAVPALLVVARR